MSSKNNNRQLTGPHLIIKASSGVFTIDKLKGALPGGKNNGKK